MSSCSFEGRKEFDVGIHGVYFEVLCNKEDKDPELTVMDRIEIFMADFEKKLDWAGGITGLSTATGTIRGGYGFVQTITALGCGFIGMFGSAFAAKENMGKWEKFNNRSIYHIKEGVKNMMRGLIEAIPIVNLIFWPAILKREALTDTENKKEKDDVVGLDIKKVYQRLFGHVIQIKNKDGDTESVVTYRARYEGELKKKLVINNLLKTEKTINID